MFINRFTISCLLLLAIPAIVLYSAQLNNYEIRHLQDEITFNNVSDTKKARVVYHSFVEMSSDEKTLEGLNHKKDQGIAELFIITDEKVYLLKDGYESPTDLKSRKAKHSDKVSKWTRQRDVLRQLYDLEKERLRYLNKVGDHSPDYARISNLISLNFRRNDPTLKDLYQRSEWSRRYLVNLQKKANPGSPEYQIQEKEYKTLRLQAEKREKFLKQELYRRVLAYSKEYQYLEHAGQIEKPKAQKEAKQAVEEAGNEANAKDIRKLGIFSWLTKPPRIEEAKFYRNMPDGFPDYLSITSPGQRRPSLQRTDSENDNWVKQNMVNLYKKVRNSHLKRYANRYRELLLDPHKYNARITTSMAKSDHLCKLRKRTRSAAREVIGERIEKVKEEAAQAKAEKKTRTLKSLFRRIDIYARRGTHYTALDCDQNGITETFLVSELDFFHWKIQGMPNAISIYNNTDPEVQEIIGHLVQLAIRGDERVGTDLQKNQEKITKSVQEYIKIEETIQSQL